MTTRIFFATDVHGSEVCFLKFINAAAFYKADVLVMGGDITGKMMVPIIKETSGTASTTFMDRTWRVNTEKEMEELKKHIRRAGGYPYLCSRDDYELLTGDSEAASRTFTEVMVAETRRILDRAEEKLSKIKIKCYITPGNDDEWAIDAAFGGHEWVINPEGRVVDLDDRHQMISTGYANMTPWKCPRDVEEESLFERIKIMVDRLHAPESAIFNLHCPPYDSQLDEAPELDDTLTPVLVAGQLHMIPVGSQAVRRALETWQPLVGLHGHIHECRGEVRIGRTLCFNPGSEYATGYLRGLILDLKKGKIKQYQFTSG